MKRKGNKRTAVAVAGAIFKHTGNNLKHGGENFEHAGNNFKHRGKDFKHAGNNLKHGGKDFKHAGNNLKHGGENFKHTRESFSPVFAGNVIDRKSMYKQKNILFNN